ncbi:PspC domain-containing protein [Aquipuribacter nitratireducens]|uniref:PspC domain-containing protein n=1 Tax=Aquipuribacter nitratireducens TaxID=650104 RepID=A0ABW0GNL8_9MICO
MDDTSPTAGPAAGPTGGPTGGPAPGTRPGPLEQLWDAMRRTGVRRPLDDRWLGGVCSGTARRLGVDPTLLRVSLVALTLLGGVGVAAYAVALVLLPDHDGRIELERAARGDLTGTTVGAVALLLVAALLPGPWELLRGGPLLDPRDLVGALVLGTLLVVGLAFLPRLAGTTAPGPTPGPAPAAPGAAPTDASPPPPAPVRAPAPPPVPARPGPGPVLSAAVTGAALVVAGAAWLATELGYLDGRPHVVALSAAITLLGGAIVALGVMGRRDGAVGGAAALAIVVAVLLLLVPSWRTVQVAGDVTWRPVEVSDASRGGALGLGDAVLDLSSLDVPARSATAGGPVEVPVRVGLGELVVRVPDGLDVRVDAGVLVGSALVGEEPEAADEAGVGLDRVLRTGSDSPDVVVDARILVGTVRLVETPAP